MNTTAFFDAVRSSMFGGSLSQDVVDDLHAILAAWSLYGDGDPNKLAYLLGTAFHESDRFKGMEEYASGRLYEGRKDLGNTVAGDGVKFKGHGFVQITGRRNYTDWSRRLGVDLLENPKRVSERPIAARILVQGSMLGTFTGKKLGDYIRPGKVDFTNARRVINGTDKASLIKGYAEKFAAAVKAAGVDPIPSPPPPITPLAGPLGGAPLVDYSHFKKGVVYPRLKEAQRLARDKGYADIGNLDGKWGSLSRNTLNAFRADNGMDPDPTGALIENTIAALKASLDKVLPPERSQATVAEVEPKSPIIQQTQKASWWAKLTGWLGSGGMVALGVKDVMPVTLAGFAPYKEYLPAIPPWFWLLLALVVAAVITIGTIIATRKNANVSEIKTEEYRTGGRA